jgi:hypothetical protein
VPCCGVPCCVCCRTHLSPNYGPFPFPKDMFLKFVREKNGYFPVKIQALADGTCVHVHTPVYQVGRQDLGVVCCAVLADRGLQPVHCIACCSELCALGPSCKAGAWRGCCS